MSIAMSLHLRGTARRSLQRSRTERCGIGRRPARRPIHTTAIHSKQHDDNFNKRASGIIGAIILRVGPLPSSGIGQAAGCRRERRLRGIIEPPATFPITVSVGPEEIAMTASVPGTSVLADTPPRQLRRTSRKGAVWTPGETRRRTIPIPAGPGRLSIAHQRAYRPEFSKPTRDLISDRAWSGNVRTGRRGKWVARRRARSDGPGVSQPCASRCAEDRTVERRYELIEAEVTVIVPQARDSMTSSYSSCGRCFT
jgi:hypothetical protein